jgi:hypothetical protein
MMTPREAAIGLNAIRAYLESRTPKLGEQIDAVILAYCQHLGVDTRLMEQTRPEVRDLSADFGVFLEKLIAQCPEDGEIEI